MTANCANIISNLKKGCQEIPLQVKGFRNSGKLSKVLASYKTNKFFPKSIHGFHSVREVMEFFRGSGKAREIRDYLEKLSEKPGKKLFTHAIF